MAAGAILLLALMAPSASAQFPTELGDATLHLVVLCESTFLAPDWAGQDEVACEIRDLSRDSIVVPGSTGTSPSGHTVTLTTRPQNESANATGWQVVLGRTNAFLYGGDTLPFTVNVKATPVITTQEYHFDLLVLYQGPGDYAREIVVPFGAEVNNYDFALLSWAGPAAQRAGQDEVLVYALAITNTAVYPDSYRISITAPDDLRISTPPNVYIPPGETRVVNISVLTPHGKLYEIGRSMAITIKVNSVTGTGVYGSTGVLQMRGAYIPVYWLPLIVVGLVSASVVTRDARERAERRRLEKGSPRRVGLTPRQSVLLSELKRTDRDAYKEKKRALDTVYAERVADHRAHRKERLAEDRQEARQAKLEFTTQKKTRREERRAAAIAREEEKKAAKRARIEARREAKLSRKKEKVLTKARAKLEKAQAKQAARDAKAAAKQAKLDEKAAAKQARLAKKAAKESAKAAKKQAK